MIPQNPIDSLQDYFNDLLSDDEFAENANAASMSVDNNSQSTEKKHESIEKTQKEIGKTDKEIEKTNREFERQSSSTSNSSTSAPAVETQTNAQLAAALPRFAVPDLEQKEKLQKLLQSVPVDIDVKPAVKVETKPAFVANPTEIQEWVIETPVQVQAPVAVELKTETQAKIKTETPPKKIVDEVTKPLVATPIENKTAVESVAKETADLAFHIAGLEWMPNGLPQWAQSRFDVLLFKVSGLTLAVPLIALGQIQLITEELTPLFGQADWFMGLLPTPTGKVRTVNTAKFVMPERYDEDFVKNAKYVVSIAGVPWGLAVDSVNQPISLSPDQVKWRVDRSKRPWLAGTVKQHMCALLDIPMIGQMLMDADKNLHKKTTKKT